MKAHEIFSQAPSQTVTEILQWFRENNRDLYKTALATLANNRKLRPAFVQKKPVADQISWMLDTLKLKSSEMLGEHLLQAYLMNGEKNLLIAFCNGVGIDHDGEGSVEGDLPEELDSEKLQQTTDDLFAAFNDDVVRIYLHVFNLQTDKGWESLTKLIASDSRLAFPQS